MVPQTKLHHDPFATDPWWFVPWLVAAIVIVLVTGLLAVLWFI
jgi:hypothetical protein